MRRLLKRHFSDREVGEIVERLVETRKQCEEWRAHSLADFREAVSLMTKVRGVWLTAISAWENGEPFDRAEWEERYPWIKEERGDE